MNDRRRALLYGAIGIIVAVVLWRWLARVLPVPAGSERLGLACASLLPAVCVLNVMIVTQMRLRSRSGALDPVAGRDARPLQVNQRAISNTVEQLAGFAPALLALAMGAPEDWLPSIVAAGVVFGVARLAFWVGYLLGPVLRAPGMAATFAVNLATLLAAIRVWWP